MTNVGACWARTGTLNHNEERERERKERERERATRRCARHGVGRTESFSLREDTQARTGGDVLTKER